MTISGEERMATTCPTCHGNGKCPKCDGKTTEAGILGARECGFCDGKGYCPTCKGDGKLYNQ